MSEQRIACLSERLDWFVNQYADRRVEPNLARFQIAIRNALEALGYPVCGETSDGIRVHAHATRGRLGARAFEARAHGRSEIEAIFEALVYGGLGQDGTEFDGRVEQRIAERIDLGLATAHKRLDLVGDFRTDPVFDLAAYGVQASGGRGFHSSHEVGDAWSIGDAHRLREYLGRETDAVGFS